MLLRYSPASPFARKVRVGAAVAGVPLALAPADTLDPADTLRAQNPLGKLPTLVTQDGTSIFDSRVIMTYLDMISGGQLLPSDPKAHIASLKLQALADGIMDAGVLLLYEGRFRAPEKHEEKWLSHQRGKIERVLAALEAEPPHGDGVSVGEIALGCALGYLDFRFAGAWRASHPRLVAWQEAFAARCPQFAETAPA